MSTQPEQVNGLIASVNALKAYFEGIRASIDAKVSAMQILVTQGLSDLQVFGDGGHGSTVVNAANFFTGESGSCYLHFKLPLKADVNNEMIHLHFRGYAYGAAEVVDTTVVGYCYVPANNVINVGVSGTHSPALYKGSDGYIYARMHFPSCYYLTVAVDTTRVGNGRLFRRGEIEVIKSDNATL
jgi:hypothetical protein